MRLLDRYLLTRFIYMFAGVLVACAGLLLLTEVLDTFQDIIAHDCPLGQTLLYFVYFLPYRTIQVLPLVSIVSVLFSIGMLAHNHEILAITASGQSPSRIAVPIIAAGVAISILTALAGEFIVPLTETRAAGIKRIYIEGKIIGRKGGLVKEDVFAKGERQRFYLMKQYDNVHNVMSMPNIIDVAPDSERVVARLTASTGTLISKETTSGLTLWRFQQAMQMKFNDKGRLVQTIRHSQPLDMELERKLHTYLSTTRKPEEMGALELAGYIAMLEAHGDATGIYRTDFWLKLFFPFSSLILVIAGFAFAMRAQVGSMVIGFAQGIFFALIFYGLLAVTQAMGHRGVLAPIVAALAPLIVFSIAAVYFLRQSAYVAT
ncbi:MAG: LptF/LptG family permease [Candidatus Sumerlaeota bacterium]|nr:LptF/LptG family permease [Candidatus Sumerlaeota bacterium]